MFTSIKEGPASLTMAAAFPNSSTVSAAMLAMSGTPNEASLRAASRRRATSSWAPGFGSPIALISPWPQSIAVGFRWPRRGAGVHVFAVTAPAPVRAARSRRFGDVPHMPDARTRGVGRRTPATRQERSIGSECRMNARAHGLVDPAAPHQAVEDLAEGEGRVQRDPFPGQLRHPSLFPV